MDFGRSPLPGPGKDYGSAGVDRFEYRRRSVSFFTVSIVFLCPCIVFASVASVRSIYRISLGALGFVVLAFLGFFFLAASFVAAVAVRRRYAGENTKPFWYVFLAVSLAVALLIGALLGETSWNDDVYPARLLVKLGFQTNVDPSATSGKQYMDAGLVSFTANSTVDTNLSLGFRNGKTFCVAPIVTKPATMSKQPQSDGSIGWSIGGKQANYDFWAIGLNCCSQNAYSFDFHCGASSDAQAHDGLRLLDEGHAAIYRTAVLSAEANYGIAASHPLFFFWVRDAAAEQQNYLAMANSFLCQGIFAFATGQILAVLAGVFYKTKPQAFDWT